jgi:hypothetical protein
MAIKCNSLVSQDSSKVDWAISLANAFYTKKFNGKFEDMNCIDLALLLIP